MFGLLGGGSSTYTYGMTMDSTNVANLDIVDETGANNTAPTAASRDTESKNGNTLMIGLNGFIGVEYFIASKISIGAEYGYGFSMASTGNGETTTESWNAADQKIDTYTVEGSKSSSWSFDTGVSGANFNITFHF